VLVSDCLASYDPHPGRKSKCCAHHLKAISEALQQAPDSEFLQDIRWFLKAAIMLHKLREDLTAGTYWDKVASWSGGRMSSWGQPAGTRPRSRSATV